MTRLERQFKTAHRNHMHYGPSISSVGNIINYRGVRWLVTDVSEYDMPVRSVAARYLVRRINGERIYRMYQDFVSYITAPQMAKG